MDAFNDLPIPQPPPLPPFSAPHKVPPPPPPPIRTKLGIRKRKPRSSTIPPVVPPTLPHPASNPRIPSPLAGLSEHKRKGLRHFAVRVTRKVEEKGLTTYNEVADELVVEERALRQTAPLVDEKNIRRRVYDSLNVLMAMNIISKTKKLISWRGLHCAQESNDITLQLETLQQAVTQRQEIVERKRAERAHLSDLLSRTTAVIERNRDIATAQETFYDDLLDDLQPFGEQNDMTIDRTTDRLWFPYYLVSARRDTKIEMQVSGMRDEVRFTFDEAYNIFDNNEILKRMPPPPVFPACSTDIRNADIVSSLEEKTTFEM